MVRSVVKTAFCCVALFGVLSTNANAQSDALKQTVERAFTYTDVQRFDEALLILSQASDLDKQHVLYGLTRARILTWARKYPSAEIEFSKLLERHPENPDVMVSYAYLQLFDGKLENAEYYFSKVLRLHPDYQDASDGLRRTLNLKRERRSILDSGYQMIENIAN